MAADGCLSIYFILLSSAMSYAWFFLPPSIYFVRWDFVHFEVFRHLETADWTRRFQVGSMNCHVIKLAAKYGVVNHSEEIYLARRLRTRENELELSKPLLCNKCNSIAELTV